MRTRLAAAAFLVLGLVAACGSASRPQAAKPGTVIFTSSLSGREGIYAVHPDGTGLSLLLSYPKWATEVLWNREGTKALVLGQYAKHFRPYILDWPSRKEHPLRVKGFGPSDDPSWSPDGKKLLLAGDSVAVYDVKTHHVTKFAGLSWDDQIGWSGDSKALLVSGIGDPHTLVRKSIGGSTDAVVYTGDANAGFPQSSADGKWYSFDDFAGVNDRYFVIRSDGTHKRLIASDSGGVSAAWSPRGERLAYTTSKGTGVLELATGKRHFVAAPTNDPENNLPSWSPDGAWVLFWRFDLGHGAPAGSHLQLWAMRPNGSGAHAVTQAMTPDWGGGTETWVAATVRGTPLLQPPLVALKAPVVTTDLPVVSLGAFGARAAVATGFGMDIGGPKNPVGPLVSVTAGGASSSTPVRGCHSFGPVLLVGRQTGYDCVNDAVGYGFDAAVRLGTKRLLHTSGGEFTGTFLSGVATDGRTVAFAVERTPPPAQVTGNFRIAETRVYASTGSRPRLVGTVRGPATVESTDGHRIVLLRAAPGFGHVLSVMSMDGSTKRYPVPGPAVLDAKLAGGRLVVLQDGRLDLIDLASGSHATLRVERGVDAGSEPTLLDIHGALASYVVGAVIHVMRLTDGREVVLETPGATAGALAAWGGDGLFYAYNEAYTQHPGRLGFIGTAALVRAISAHGALAR